jgi:hypothetical protein
MRGTQPHFTLTFQFIIHIDQCYMNCAVGLASMKTNLNKAATYRCTQVNVLLFLDISRIFNLVPNEVSSEFFLM